MNVAYTLLGVFHTMGFDVCTLVMVFAPHPSSLRVIF